MTHCIQRTINEKSKLDIKISVLEVFINSTTFFNLELSDRELLKVQFDCMKIYSRILRLRIGG